MTLLSNPCQKDESKISLETMNTLMLTNLFNLYKKKADDSSLLSEIFSDEFLEINRDLLSGLNNGSISIEESLDLLKAYKKLGIQNVVCTFPVSSDHTETLILKYLAEFEKLKNLANYNSQRLNINLTYCAEYVLDDNFSNLIKGGKLFTLQKKWIFVTLPSSGTITEWKDRIGEIRKCGYSPILTQPERQPNFRHDLAQFFELKSAGCFFKIALTSLLQDDAEGIQTISHWMLRNNLVDFATTNLTKPNNQLIPVYKLTNQPIFELLKPIIQNTYQLKD